MILLFRKYFNLKEITKYIKANWLTFLLLSISLWDIRIEIRLLIENFTLIGLLYAIYNHPLAFVVLIMIIVYFLIFKKETFVK